MNEQVVTFGSNQSMVGVLTEPAAECRVTGTPCILILNAGILHHVGPFRLHVLAARKLAEYGYTTFRLDVSGIGDSTPVKSAGYDTGRVISDIQSAMDVLSGKRAFTEYVLMGLCTGAANSQRVAIIDDRVKGGIFLDGYAYPTLRFYIRRYLPALTDPIRLKNAALLRIKQLIMNANSKETETIHEDFGWWDLPGKRQAADEYRALIQRDVQLLYIYSGEDSEACNYEDQLKDAFSTIDFGNTLNVIINKEADHTYIFAEDRNRLLEQISSWLNERFSVPKTADI